MNDILSFKGHFSQKYNIPNFKFPCFFSPNRNFRCLRKTREHSRTTFTLFLVSRGEELALIQRGGQPEVQANANVSPFLTNLMFGSLRTTKVGFGPVCFSSFLEYRQGFPQTTKTSPTGGLVKKRTPDSRFLV